jgi:hypothetical protein
MHRSETGSLRANTGKPEITQLDPRFITHLAHLITVSAVKYEKFNYALGQDYLTPCDSLLRHLMLFMQGEDVDKESGFHHALHIGANAMILYSSILRNADPEVDLDNRFKGFNNEK